MTTITKSIENDFGGQVNTSQLQELILESGINDVENRLVGINTNGDVLEIVFNDTLTQGEIDIIEDIIENYVFEPQPEDPQIVPIYVNGTFEPSLRKLIVSANVSSGTVTFNAVDEDDDPIFDSIIASSAKFSCFSTTTSYIFGSPTLAGDKRTISATVRTTSPTTTTILGIVVLNGTSIVNAVNGTTVNMTIYGQPAQ